MVHGPTRRRFLGAAATAFGASVAGCSASDGDGTPPDDGTDSPGSDAGTPDAALPESFALETLVSGLDASLDIRFSPEADRRYVAEQQGIVHVHESGGLRSEPLLDLRETVDFGGEKGLLGIELHPAFAENRRLFVRYSSPRREGTPSNYSHTFVLAEFEVREDGRRVRADSERTVLEIPQPQGNHNAGDLAFGPDGYLYVAVGDGGAGSDQGEGHVADWYDGVAGGNGQDVTENLLGSILRLDVDTGERGDYGIPEDNPLVGREGLDEQFAWGLRNPYRMSFDGADLFAGDVGQSRYEEINLVTAGGNYGWNVREGAHCYEAEDCPTETPPDVRGGEPLVDPIVEYPHSDAAVGGISVIGGYVYRGSAVEGLGGAYVFGDLQANGRLFVATRPDEGRTWPTRAVPLTEGASERLQRILSFGRDSDGEVYVLGLGSEGGAVHRLVAAE